MSDRFDDVKFDDLIDSAARSLTDAPAPEHLKARVFARLDAGHESWWKAPWLVPAGALACVCMAAAGLYVGSGISRSSSPSSGPAANSARQAEVGLPDSTIRLKPDPISQGEVWLQSNATTADVTAGTVVSSREEPVQVVQVEEPPAGFASIIESEMTIDPIDSNQLGAVAPMTIEALGADGLTQ